MTIWCTLCQEFAITKDDDVHALHKDKLVYIDVDVFKEHMRRMIWELRKTGRVLPRP